VQAEEEYAMARISTNVILAVLGVAVAAAMFVSLAPSQAAGPLPEPKLDAALASAPAAATAVLAGGCFWGVEAVFEHVRGVTRIWTPPRLQAHRSLAVRYDCARISGL
jgi:peptide-methionine (S)-S-oxide reductase